MGNGPAASLYDLVDWPGTRFEILFAVIHCTGGDVLITASALTLAALVARMRSWPFFGNRMALTSNYISEKIRASPRPPSLRY
jgi:hypothetical protein